jgi:hypothetical protein
MYTYICNSLLQLVCLYITVLSYHSLCIENLMGFMKPMPRACRNLHLWLQAWVQVAPENPRVVHDIP